MAQTFLNPPPPSPAGGSNLEGWTWILPAAAVLLLLFSLALRGKDLPRPYADGNSKSEAIEAANYQIAWNFVRYGYGPTRCLQVMNPQPAPPEHWVFYLNHPSTFTLLQSLVFRAAGGRSFAAARLLPLAAFLFQLLFLFRIARRSLGREWAAAATALYALFPMTLLYAWHANYEPFCLLSLLVFVDSLQEGRLGKACLAGFLGGLFDFPSFYGPFLFVAGLWVFQVSRKRISPVSAFRVSAALGASCAAALVLFFLHISLVPRDTGFFEYLKTMFTADPAFFARAIHFSWPAFAGSQARFFLAGFGASGLLLAALGLVPRGRGLRTAGPIPLLLACGLFHLLVFRYHAHVHAFWGIYLAPAFALLAGRALKGLAGLLPSRKWGLLLGAGLLVLAGGEGAFRFLRVRARVDPTRPQKWARALEGILPPDSVAVLSHPAAPPFWGVECYTRDLAVKSNLLYSRYDLDNLAALLRKYHLEERRVFAVVEAGAARALGLAKVRAFMEEGVRKGRFLGEVKPGGGGRDLPSFYVWEITRSVFSRKAPGKGG